MSFESALLTKAGKEMAIRGLSGDQIIFTRIQIGTGEITDQQPRELTDLISPLASGAIVNFIKKETGVKIVASFQNADLVEEFYWREVGLYVRDPDDSQKEILYAYQNAYDKAEHITPANMVTRNASFNIAVDDTDSLTAEQHKELVYATLEDIDNLKQLIDNLDSGLPEGVEITIKGKSVSINNVQMVGNDGKSPYAVATGTLITFAGQTAPKGYVKCDGAELNRTMYSALFEVIGTTYGAGDGSTTFNLPDYTNRFIQGDLTAGTVKEAGLPNITGETTTNSSYACAGGAFVNHDYAGTSDTGTGMGAYRQTFNASRSSSIYGKSSTVQPPAITALICIKY